VYTFVDGRRDDWHLAPLAAAVEPVGANDVLPDVDELLRLGVKQAQERL
jgi:hypothetical protein